MKVHFGYRLCRLPGGIKTLDYYLEGMGVAEASWYGIPEV